jgi:hypothetical protein
VREKQKASSCGGSRIVQSDLFQKMRRYALLHADEWYILSAEHGLLAPDQVIAPYELTLNRIGKTDRLAWAKRVQEQLLDALPSQCEVIVLAGERYRENLIPFLKEHGFVVKVPLEGLSFGRQLQKLAELEMSEPNERD